MMKFREKIMDSVKTESTLPQCFTDGMSLPFSVDDCIVLPGLCDVHVHLRGPGYFCKETIKSGTLASARGIVGHVESTVEITIADCHCTLSPHIAVVDAVDTLCQPNGIGAHLRHRLTGSRLAFMLSL